MENLDLIEQQKKFLKQLQERQEYLRSMFGTEGFVVAGYGGDTYYAYVGVGNGFNGAALLPISSKPVVFDTLKDARKEAVNGFYRNGHNDLIVLRAVKADTYFRRIYEIFEKNLDIFKAQFSELANNG